MQHQHQLEQDLNHPQQLLRRHTLKHLLQLAQHLLLVKLKLERQLKLEREQKVLHTLEL